MTDLTGAYDIYSHYMDIAWPTARAGIFVGRAKEFGKVLEIGSGTGATATLIAKSGTPVVCIEPSREMLKISRGKAAKENVDCTFVQSTAEEFDVGEVFPFIFIKLVYGHFITEGERHRVLARVVKHLAPDGEFMFDVANLALVSQSVDETLQEEVQHGGFVYKRYLTHEPRTQDYFMSIYRIEQWKDDELVGQQVVESPVALLSSEVIIEELKAFGFELVGVYGEEIDKPFDETADPLMTFHWRFGE